ncbi:MAG: membrane protein insertion efficiency factor YidD [Candidatus Paceibacterota bacterium]|jgi:putative membrane protein insertion efficiency factor|nr:membrane protein insertion efficiency factor YidD [Candidatus Paceibacterota bacterium]MDD3072700.1 membrane protein insertion efficiency factor YidD [Candidatus Paceibacterota bacterium]MDD4467148.1 membrane protein insertion efficiency factor YidD [Candidatus Paceibacterota bacterium]MDD4897631.1 membrane protein insertion efficiency factor YidD [Candidatus Paceibacterota bacterium]
MFKKSILFLISFYHFSVSPFLGKNCRFYPSCSDYTYKAVEKYGPLKGIFLGTKRILKCHPFNKGGVDIP